MTQADITKGLNTLKNAGAEQQLCPQCGLPVYDCGCTNRWEDEGGALPPTTQDPEPEGKANKPGPGI